MNNQELDIEALKKDSEFLDNLKKLEKEMRDENSVAKGYQLLDAKLVIEASEDEVNDLFTFIVNTSFDTLAEYLSKNQKFDLGNPEDWATARAIYEHGIQRYSENDKKGAKEIFLVLYHMIEDEEIREAMLVHVGAVMAGHSFDDFIDNLVDIKGMNPEDPNSFFITTFVQPVDILQQMFSRFIVEAKEELKVLEEQE